MCDFPLSVFLEIGMPVNIRVKGVGLEEKERKYSETDFWILRVTISSLFIYSFTSSNAPPRLSVQMFLFQIEIGYPVTLR